VRFGLFSAYLLPFLAKFKAENLTARSIPDDPPPVDIRSWPLWLTLRSHLAALIKAAAIENINEPTARLANELGLLLYIRGYGMKRSR
jgi:hypothetical protein